MTFFRAIRPHQPHEKREKVVEELRRLQTSSLFPVFFAKRSQMTTLCHQLGLLFRTS
jgi:hypothetical protein